MKKIFRTLLLTAVVLLCATLLPHTAQAASTSDLTFELNSDGESYSVTDCDISASGVLEIPATYNGKPVTIIGRRSLENCSSLTSINIPDSITTIGYRAFYGCKNLTSIIIPDNVTSIGSDAFYFCSNLTSLTIGSGVTSIAYHAFHACNLTDIYITNWSTWFKLVGDQNCPYANNMHFINEDGKEITEIILDSSVTAIPDCGFRGFKNMTSITIPDSVTSIGYNVFYNCSSLETITMPFAGGEMSNRLFGSFFGSSSYDGSVSVQQNYQDYTSHTYYIPSGLKSVTVTSGDIPYCAFHNFESLTDITIGDGVSNIASRAFDNCKNLTSITIGSGITSIGADAFSGCTSLTDVYVMDVNAWCKITFNDSSANPAFQAENLHLIDEDGQEITELVLDNSITTIPAYCFYGCRNLTSVTIGSGVINIGNGAFSNCTSLTDVYITDFNSWCKITGSGNPMYYADNLHLIGRKDEEITEIVLDSSVTAIPSYSFKNLKYMTRISIPDSVISIGTEAFSGCVGLKSIVIPDGVTNIGYGVFSGCSSLESLTIPFVGAKLTKLSDAYQYPLGYLFGTSAFSKARATEQFYYGRLDTGWITGARLAEESNTYYIPKSLKSVIVTGGNISYGAFSRCYDLTSVIVLGNNVNIDHHAFFDCSITSVFLSSGTAKIGYDAFVERNTLKDVYYAGSKSQWESIAENVSDSLKNVTKHYDMRLVTLKNWDGTILNTQAFQQGQIIATDFIPVKAADNTYTYAFSGWDQTVCTGDMEVTAQYTATYIDYMVEFKNWDGSVLQTKTYHWDDPVAAPDDPVRPYDDTYYYVFTGWDADVTTACDGSKTYIAVYEEKERATPPTPLAPLASDYTQTIVILQAVTGCEYSMDGVNWQDSNVFEKLTANTEYVFYQRVKETAATYSSGISPATNLTTLPKAACTVVPALPIIADYTSTKIVLLQREGYEYRLNNGAWTTNPTFTGLQANTSYTVYQRIAETAEGFAGDTSQGVTVKTATAPTGKTSASRYEQLRQYIYDHATSSNGKVLLITQSQSSANYTYRLTNQNEGITFSMVSEHKGSSGFDITTHFTLYPDSKNINVSCTVSYFSGGKVMDMAMDTISVNRSTYTVSTKLVSSESGFRYITSSDFSGLATSTMGVLCTYWNAHLLSNLGFGLEDLGFISFANNASVCDIPSGYHAGVRTLRNQRAAGCVIDGYTGDYYCASCGEKTESGSAIAATGVHSYGNCTTVNDTTHKHACTICSEEETAEHIWDSGAVTKVPTCKETGATTYTCVGCQFTRTEPIAKTTDHKYGDWTKVNNSTHKRTCSVCSKQETENHNWSSSTITNPTCTEQGYTTHTCVCDDSYKDTYVDADGHSYVSVIVKPVPGKQGYTEHTCHCGDSYRDNYVDALDMSAPMVTITVDAATGNPSMSWVHGGEGVTYEIHRATSKTGSYTKVATVAESSWIDTAASVGKTYYYKVKAIYAEDASYNSGFSVVVSATAKCAAPVLTVKAGSTGKPVLSWNKITGAKKYEIWRSVDGGAFKKLTTVTKLTYTDTKATAGAECSYKVKALGSKSTYNGEFSETGCCYVTCAAPSITLKLDSKTGKPALSWKKITGAKSYAIYRSANGGQYELLTTTTAVSYQDKSAAPDNKYSYYVITVGKAEVFNSVPSAAKSVTLAVKMPKLTGSADAKGKPVISWAKVENAVSYKIYRSTKSGKGYSLVKTTADLSYTDTTVATGKTFYYKVVAVGANTESAMSSYLKMVGKCATPTIQVAVDETSGKPVLSWEKISGAKKYTVYRATSESGKYSKLGTSTKLTYTDAKATVGTKYFYKIVANPSSSSANSNYSNIESCLTICAKAVVTVKVDAATGKPTLSWGKVTGAKSYEIYRSENGGAYVLVATQTAVSYKDTTAVAGNAYSYQVKVIASKTGADSLLSAEKTVIATCAQPKIKGKVGATGKPELTWNAVEGATKYVIYRSTSKSKNYKVIDETTDLTFTDATATKGKTYYYKVVAVCEDVESAQSAYCKVKSK